MAQAVSSNVVIVHVGQFLDKLGPVLAAHLNYSAVKAIVLHFEVAAVCGFLESLVEVVAGGLRVTVGSNHSHHQASLFLRVFHRYNQWLVLCLGEALLAAVHDEVGKFDEG